MELLPIDERVRMLCARAAVAREDEAHELLAELRFVLKEHAHFVRLIAVQTLTRLQEKSSSSFSA